MDDFRASFPNRPIVLMVTGTDIYGSPATLRKANESLSKADRIVTLQPKARESLSKAVRKKTRVIFQSAQPATKRKPRSGLFEISVVGHLRPVKDPFRAAMAARLLPTESRIHVTHCGAALTQAMQRRAESEMQRNPRYQWIGDRTHTYSRSLIARSRAMAITSKSEGGASVIAEAIMSGTPVLASKIDGNVGLLGSRYPGYFEQGDQRALARLMLRLETQTAFQDRLAQAVHPLQSRFDPDTESAAIGQLLREFT